VEEELERGLVTVSGDVETAGMDWEHVAKLGRTVGMRVGDPEEPPCITTVGSGQESWAKACTVGIGDLRVTQPSKAGSKLTRPVLSVVGSQGGCNSLA
jgi:hypothetical protein